MSKHTRRPSPPPDVPPGTSTARLVEALEALPKSAMRDRVLQRARYLDYHDFRSEAYDMPKVALVTDLRALGTAEAQVLAGRVMEGEFDEGKEEADAWAAAAGADPEMAAALEALLKKN